MRFGSVCSGIEAASQALEPHGWTAAWFSEIEPFPCALLAYRYPQVPNLGDMSALPQRVRDLEVEAPDLLCGGTPCQAFSVAGDRESLDDARGNLTLTFCELADAIDDVRVARGEQPCDILWENVPGIFSTADNAFGCFLGQLVGAGAPLVPGRQQRWTDAGVVAGPRRIAAWRVLDAQHFGLAQRRRRVFVVASARAGFDPAAVLLERKGVRGDPPARRRAQQDAASSAGRGTARSSWADGPAGTLRSTDVGAAVDHAPAGHVIPSADVVGALTASEGPNGHGHSGFTTRTAVDAGHLVTHVKAYGGNNTAGPIDVATAVRAKGGTGHGDFESETFIAFDPTQITCPTNRSQPKAGDPCHTLAKDQHPPAIACVQLPPTSGVRRLTARECERLQGFPDDWTLVPNWDGWRPMDADETPESCREEGLDVRQAPSGNWRVRDADGPRYKAIGNSWAVDVVLWIAGRLTASRSKR